MITAIVNPASADGKTTKAWPAILAALETELGIVQVHFTKERYHAVELTRHAILQGATTVIAVGGDGTVNEVVNGLCRQESPSGPSGNLAIILRGTGSDFVRSWTSRQTIAEIAQAIKHNVSQPCDVVRAHVATLAGESAERYYINVADVGVGGQVVNIVNNSPKFLGGSLSFFLAGLRATLFQYRNAPLRIELDGRLVCEHTPHYFVAVANGQYFGGGMHIAPEACVHDGLLDVVMIGNLSLPEKVFFATKLYRGKAKELQRVNVARVRRVSIASPYPVFIEADGELIGTTDAHFEVLPSALNVLGWN
jgi:YegS/Rv2252/BmrU family lipid kinase